MADKGDEGEKEFEATAQKIEQMRRDGNTLVLSEIFAVAALWGTITIVLISGEFVIGRFSLLLGSIFSDAARLDFWTVPASQISRVLLNAVLLTFLLFIPALCLVIVAGVIQRAFVFAPKKVLPSPSRISPVSNAKNKLGSKGLYEFSKSTIKSKAVVGVFIYFITAELMPGSATRITDARIGISELARLHVEFATLAAVVLTLISGVDAIYQRADYFRQARMTRSEGLPADAGSII